MLVQYLRDEKNQKRGVFVAESDGDNGYMVGWSVCSKRDIFSKVRGNTIAVGRMLRGTKASIPSFAVAQFDKFLSRCEAYYVKDVD